jgi:hypothetical protein
MARIPTLICPNCQHAAAAHRFPPSREGLLHVRRCPTCGLVVQHNGRPVNGAAAGYQRLFNLPTPADQRAAQSPPPRGGQRGGQ